MCIMFCAVVPVHRQNDACCNPGIVDLSHPGLVLDPYFIFYEMNLSSVPLLDYSSEFLTFDIFFRFIVELNDIKMNDYG